MSAYLMTIAAIMAIGFLGIAVDRLYRAFARNNPELGPFRDPDKGCGSCTGNAGCSDGACTSGPK